MQGAFGHNADHCNADVHHLDAGYYADTVLMHSTCVSAPGWLCWHVTPLTCDIAQKTANLALHGLE